MDWRKRYSKLETETILERIKDAIENLQVDNYHPSTIVLCSKDAMQFQQENSMTFGEPFDIGVVERLYGLRVLCTDTVTTSMVHST